MKKITMPSKKIAMSLPVLFLVGDLGVVAIGCDDYECDDKEGQVTCGYCDEDHLVNEYGGQCRYCDEGTVCSGDVCGDLSCVAPGGGGSGNDNGSCNSGYCYTGVSCCPTSAPWQGGDNCYQTSDDCHSDGYSTCYGC